MHELFAPGEMALNVCRTCIGSSDYSRSVYSFDESAEPDPELRKFSDRPRQGIHPADAARGAQGESRAVPFLVAVVPAGMDEGQRLDAGRGNAQAQLRALRPLLPQFLDGYKAEGVPIDAVTVQNEVDAEQDGNMPACLWAQE